VKLIVGLGNPGTRYRGTRHNVGFEVIDRLARRSSVGFEPAPVNDGQLARVHGAGEQTMLAKPLTYMNRSGEAVAALQRYFRVDLGDMLVVADDVNLPLGRLRARRRGSDGGNKGLRSLIDALGTEEFARLRVGVGRGQGPQDGSRVGVPGDPGWTLSNHVLARFDADEEPEIRAAIERAADAVDVFVHDGIDAVMNRFNRTEPIDSEESEITNP
jgi:PTH1 family peptidyl-tRNA hydrolase